MRIHPPIRFLHLSALLLIGPLVFVACGGDGGTNPVDPAVSLSPPNSTIFVGDEVSLTATVTGTSGAATFNSSAPGVASVDAAGKVTGVSPGTATITASAGGASASAQITVSESSIALGPPEPSLLPDETAQLTATITGGSGHTVSWATGDADIATVDNAGLVTAVSPGSTTVTASVDGQPGVEAAVIVEVLVPAPVVEIVSFEDALGAPLNLESVTGFFIANLQITGYVGAQATVEIYFDGELYATAPFTIPEPQPVAGSGPLLMGGKSLQDVPLAISTLKTENLQDGRIEAVLSNLPHAFSGQLEHNGDRANIVIRGVGNSTEMTTNNPSVGMVHVTHLGRTLLVDGKTYGNGDLGYQVGLTSPGQFDIDRIEVLRGPQGTLFGKNAVGGVVNFISTRAENEGFEGHYFTEKITAFDQGGASQDVFVANQIPEVFYDFDLEENTYVDYAGPSASAPPVAMGDLIVGPNTDVQAYMATMTGFGAQDLTDVTGISKSLWQFKGPSEEWDPEQEYTVGLDFQPTDGFTIWSSYYAEDGFDQGSRFITENGSGSHLNLAVDFTIPTGTVVPGPWNLSDMAAINTHGPWQMQYDAFDYPYPGFSWSSGINNSGYDFRMKYRAPDLQEQFLYGDADGLERVPFDFKGGWELPWTVAGEYYLDMRATDNAGNASEELNLKVTYNHMGPVLTIPTLSGQNSENLFAARGDIGVQLNAQDAVENYLATAGAYSPTADLYQFGDVVQLGTPYDGSFQNNSDLDLTLSRFVPRIGFVGGPWAPLGWVEFSTAGAGVVNTAGLSTTSLVDISASLPPAGDPFSLSQIVSLFSDQTLSEFCLTTGPDCAGRSSTGTVSGRAWNPIANGFPNFTDAQLYAMKFGPGGENMFRSVGDPVPVDIVPFGGSGYEVQFSLTFNVMDVGLTEQYDRLFWGLWSPDGDLYATDSWPLSIKYKF